MSPQYRMGKFGGSSVFPPVIKGLLIANVIVFLLENLFGSYGTNGLNLHDLIFRYCALFPIDSGYFYPWQILTYQFLHGGFSHIFFNMIMLWMFGVELENMWGSRRFFIFYLLSGIGAGLVQLFISPYLGTTGPTVGASGSIYGIFIAFALSFPDRQLMVFPLFIPIKAKYLILILIGMDFVMGLSSSDSVAHFAHLGGAASGWFLLKYGDKTGIFSFINKIIPEKNNQYSNTNIGTTGFGIPKNPKPEAKVFKTDWFKHNETKSSTINTTAQTSKFHVNGEEIDQSKIDEILDKISQTGYQNLTEREKAILFELSQKLK